MHFGKPQLTVKTKCAKTNATSILRRQFFMFKLGYARLKKQIACDFLAGITSKAQGMLINVYSV